MVLSSEELSLLHGLINGIQNTTTYGYEVAVKGTIVDGIATFVTGLITIIATIYVAKKMYTWAEIADKERPTYDKGFPYALAVVGVIAALLVFAIASGSVIYDPFMKIFAPEYIVIKQVLAAAASAAT
jgi:hypothetical protein